MPMGTPDLTQEQPITLQPSLPLEVVNMIDTIHLDVGMVPPTTPIVGGYDTGSVDIRWMATDWDRFPASTKVHINQDPAASHRVGNGFDVEPFAWTPRAAAEAVRQRELEETDSFIYTQAGRQVTPDGTVWGLVEVIHQLVFAGVQECDIWLADWNFSETEAHDYLVAHQADKYPTKSVQWASPSSNPNTLVPGGNGQTLQEANVDLSVAVAHWAPGGSDVPPPPPPPPTVIHGVVVWGNPPECRLVSSEDGGKHWS